VDLSFPRKDACALEVRFHTHGPLEVDLPAYTLRNCGLLWEILLPDGESVSSQDEANLAVLAPGSEGSIKVEPARLRKRPRGRPECLVGRHVQRTYG
jgi:hypothetical protein